MVERTQINQTWKGIMRGNKEEILHFFDINKILVNHSWDGAVPSDINNEVNENNAK